MSSQDLQDENNIDLIPRHTFNRNNTVTPQTCPGYRPGVVSGEILTDPRPHETPQPFALANYSEKELSENVDKYDPILGETGLTRRHPPSHSPSSQ